MEGLLYINFSTYFLHYRNHFLHQPARLLGMSNASIAALRGEPEGEDGLIVRAVDALFDEKRLSLALEAELAAAIGRPGVST